MPLGVLCCGDGVIGGFCARGRREVFGVIDMDGSLSEDGLGSVLTSTVHSLTLCMLGSFVASSCSSGVCCVRGGDLGHSCCWWVCFLRLMGQSLSPLVSVR